MMAVCMLADHDEAWFRNLYAETYQPLLAYARRRVDAATADEVVADTFLTAWRRRDDVPDSSARLWLFGVARNMIRNAARSSRRREAAHDRLQLVRPAASDDPAAPDTGERLPVIRAALADLPDPDREVLMLVAWEELSHAEIGQVLGISANASAIRVHRARKRLAARLEQLEGAAADGSNVKALRRRGQASGERSTPHQLDPSPDDSAGEPPKKAQ